MSPRSVFAAAAATTAAFALCPTGSASAYGGWHGWHAVDHGTSFTDKSHLLDFNRVDEPLTTKLGGAAWLDYDDDGDLDLYLSNAPGGNNALMRNDGGAFVDVADEAGVLGGGTGATATIAADVDNDGCTDLFLTGAGGFFGIANPHHLYMNNCDGTFTDATATSGIDPLHLGLAASFGDIDRDGYLDLFLASPGNFGAGVLTTQKLYHNNGDGTFSDISASAGIDTALGGCVVGFSDFSEDGYPDILLGNCNNLDVSGPVPAPIPGPWELWINQGDLSFVDEAVERGLGDDPGFPMAVTIADYDRDGDMDVFATGAGVADPFMSGSELSEQTMFENVGGGHFEEVTYAVGLGGYEFGWGASFADFDNDGDDDLAMVGSVAVSVMQLVGPLALPGRVFDNDGTGQMTPIADFGLEFQATSGLAVADYDADGFSDMVIIKTEYDQPVTPFGPISGDGRPVLMHNDGNDNHSVTVRLVGDESNAMGIGARIKAFVPGYGWQFKELAAGSSFASTNSPWTTIGLRNRHFAWVVVDWPSGNRELWGLPWWGGGLRTLEEGTGYPL